MSRRILAGLAAFAAGASVALVASPAGAWADTSTATSAPTMVILDGSGSMLAKDAPGQRIVAAKKAVDGLLDSLPSDARLGLEVYGTSTSSAGSAKAAGCRDITTVVPVGPVDKTSFSAKVAAVRARGYTPIGSALRKAAAQLPAEGARSIVLVSDGEDTCAPPAPCDVARELHRRGVDLAIHAVGFKVDDAARSQLQCIASATGGTYQDADSGDSLATRLQTQVDRALRGYQAEGTPIDGSDNAGDGPLVKPGQYVDTFAALPSGVTRETTKYYSIDLDRGDTPYFSATIIPPARRTAFSILNISVTIKPAGDGYCTVSGSGDDVGVGGKLSASTAVAAPASDNDRECLAGGGPMTVKVTRSGTAFAGEPLKVELAYHAEPPADASGQPAPAGVADTAAVVQASGSSTPIHSGSSFNDAPRLAAGVYRDSFVSGETRFVKVHVGWGQVLAYSLTPTKLSGLGIGDGVGGELAVLNPLRQQIGLAAGSDSVSSFLGYTDSPLSGSSAAQVRYRNRDADDSRVRPISVPGDYYLVLSTSFTSDGDRALTVPYTLRIGVVGAEQQGPRYLTEPLPANGGSGSASGSGAGTTSQSSPPQADRRDDSAVPTAAIVGGGGAALVLIAGLAGFLLIRRRSAQHVQGTDTAVLPTHDGW